MQSSNLTLRTINNGAGIPVPIIVKPQFSLFEAGSSMSCEIQGLQSTPILWEQISGVPVTFTSSLKVNPVEFTTNDLGTIVLRCYTNYGTSYEMYDDGEFTHYPMEYTKFNQQFYLAWKTRELADQPISASGDSAIGSVNGVVADSIAKTSRVRVPSDPEDIYMEYVIYGNKVLLNEYVVQTRFQKFDGNAWIDIEVHDGFVDKFSKYTSLNGIPKRIVLKVYEYGTLSEIILEVVKDGKYTIGAADYIKSQDSLLVSTNKYKLALSTYTSVDKSDTAIKADPFYISNIKYNYWLQYRTFIEKQEVTLFSENFYLSTNKYIAVLQTSTGVI